MSKERIKSSFQVLFGLSFLLTCISAISFFDLYSLYFLSQKTTGVVETVSIPVRGEVGKSFNYNYQISYHCHNIKTSSKVKGEKRNFQILGLHSDASHYNIGDKINILCYKSFFGNTEAEETKNHQLITTLLFIMITLVVYTQTYGFYRRIQI